MKSLPWMLLVLLCSSCLKYQYATVRSSLQSNPEQGIFFENDTVKVVYEFTGYNGPVSITVHNKLDKPLYIDWSKSAIIVQNKRISYWSPNAVINGSVGGSEFRWTNSFSTSFGSISGTISQQAALSFIPPHSFAKEEPIYLRTEFFPVPVATKKNKKKINNLNVTAFSFDASSSPLAFRSFLTLSSESFPEPVYLDHEFWVSEVVQTMGDPALFPKKKNQFELRKGTGFGTVVGLTALTGIVLIVAALDDESQ